MVPVGTAAKAWRSPAISLYWSCRPTARNSIRSSGFGTICAATGSPTRYFPAWRTSWMPARWPGTGSPLTTAWSARFARSPGLQLRPLHKEWLLSNRGLRYKIHPYPTTSGDSYKRPRRARSCAAQPLTWKLHWHVSGRDEVALMAGNPRMRRSASSDDRQGEGVHGLRAVIDIIGGQRRGD